MLLGLGSLGLRLRGPRSCHFGFLVNQDLAARDVIALSYVQ